MSKSTLEFQVWKLVNPLFALYCFKHLLLSTFSLELCLLTDWIFGSYSWQDTLIAQFPTLSRLLLMGLDNIECRDRPWWGRSIHLASLPCKFDWSSNLWRPHIASFQKSILLVCLFIVILRQLHGHWLNSICRFRFLLFNFTFWVLIISLVNIVRWILNLAYTLGWWCRPCRIFHLLIVVLCFRFFLILLIIATLHFGHNYIKI